MPSQAIHPMAATKRHRSLLVTAKGETILLSFNNLPADDINRKILEFEDSFDSVWVDITQGPITTEKIDSAMNYLDEKYQSNDVFFSEVFQFTDEATHPKYNGEISLSGFCSHVACRCYK